jgi:hypothetical protein
MFFSWSRPLLPGTRASPVMPASIRVSARTGTHAPYDRFNVTEQTSLRQAHGIRSPAEAGGAGIRADLAG